MKIYVTHSTSFDYINELYLPIRMSQLNKSHSITLPHETSKAQFNSKEFINKCDLVIAEVSYPSTGQGIELGWADGYGIPIVSFYKTGTRPSSAIDSVCKDKFEYSDTFDLIDKISLFLKDKA